MIKIKENVAYKGKILANFAGIQKYRSIYTVQ